MASKNKKIIAVVGMCGAGKTEAVNYLKEKLNCPHIYFGAVTFDRLRAEKIEVNYENEKKMREKIRKELGMGAYALLSLPKIRKALSKSELCLIESLYSWDEYKIMKENFGNDFITIAIYASPATRFKRLLKRNNERPMASLSEFISRDYSEIEKTDKGGPIARADFLVYNEKGLKDMKKQIDKILETTNIN